MRTLLIILSAYLFGCYGLQKDVTPEGLLLVFATTFIVGTFAVARANREVTIYFNKEQIEEMLDDEE